MIKKIIFFIIIFLCFFQGVIAQEQAKPAKEILNHAYSQAADANKNVIIIFHASWCGWCRKMDAALNDPSCKSFFDENYIIEHLVVYEPDGKKHLENPGATEFMVEHGGEGQGIPFWLIFDKTGELLTTSKFDSGNNIGCPASDNEVAGFIKKIKETSSLKEEELAIIAERFKKNRN